MKSTLLLAIALSLGLLPAAMAASSDTPKSAPADTRYGAAQSAIQAGQYARAIDLLQKFVGDQPGNADAQNALGFSHRKLDHLEVALAHYKKALQLDGEHRGANEYLGELYLRMGQLGEAEARLARLDALCFFGCDEFDDLKAAIQAYKTKHKA